MAPSAVLPGSIVTDVANSNGTTASKLNGLKLDSSAPSCRVCTNGNKVTISSPTGEYTFHSQWLHDARCDDGAQRNSTTAIGRQPLETVKIDSAEIVGGDTRKFLAIVWNDGLSSEFPVEWLWVMAPIVAATTTKSMPTFLPVVDDGWTTDSINIPEISYHAIFSTTATLEEVNSTALRVLDLLLSPRSAGIVKIVDLPEPNFEDELNHTRNINTLVLKKLFGSVFVHPTRGSDRSFNVSSRSAEATKRKNLPNYDTNQVLLPHADHAFYEHPINVQGWYILEV